MHYPQLRLRRRRKSFAIRKLLRETKVSVEDLIYPLFVCEGDNKKEPVDAMPGVFRYSIDLLLDEVDKARQEGILAVLLFGVTDKKDELATAAYDDDGVVQKAVRALKKNFPDLVVITDVCLCGYTNHGHCGVIRDDIIVNDETLELLARTALSHARAGADLVAPSDMMDGRVGAIRERLDQNGLTDVGILSYAAKFASAFYGPFREAAGSAPSFGDRRSYQMDPANRREAMEEVLLDLDEGADMIMIKPALAYMDIIREVRENILCPLVAYNVSGEYAMVKAAAANGWIDEKMIVMETMTGMKRAGADLIITYHAIDMAHWLQEE